MLRSRDRIELPLERDRDFLAVEMAALARALADETNKTVLRVDRATARRYGRVGGKL